MLKQPTTTNLGTLLKTLYFLVEAGKGLTIEAEVTLKELIEIRKRGRPSFYEAKLMSDYKKFLFFRGRREHTKEKAREQNCFHCIEKEFRRLPPLQEEDWYWGTRQQLRCGEIIADTLGALDAVFGVLLHPAGTASKIYCCFLSCPTMMFIILVSHNKPSRQEQPENLDDLTRKIRPTCIAFWRSIKLQFQGRFQ